jgi:hypothetical protein
MVGLSVTSWMATPDHAKAILIDKLARDMMEKVVGAMEAIDVPPGTPTPPGFIEDVRAMFWVRMEGLCRERANEWAKKVVEARSG